MGFPAAYLLEGHEIHPVLNQDALRCARCRLEVPGHQWTYLTGGAEFRDFLKAHPCAPGR